MIIKGILSDKKIEKSRGEIYLRTQFLYYHGPNQLVLHLWDESRSVYIDKILNLTTDDKIVLLTAINKENNRIKNMLEQDKTKEYKTDSLKPYYDSVKSKELKNGIEWQYIKDGKVEDTAFMSYKELYEIQIKTPKICTFCDSTEVTKIMPREEEKAIYLCDQHMKYIARITLKDNDGSIPMI